MVVNLIPFYRLVDGLCVAAVLLQTENSNNACLLSGPRIHQSRAAHSEVEHLATPGTARNLARTAAMPARPDPERPSPEEVPRVADGANTTHVRCCRDAGESRRAV